MLNPIDLVNRYYAAINARDWATTATLLGDDCVMRAPGYEAAGREAATRFDRVWAEAFDGFTIVPARQIAAGDTVVSESRVTGTHNHALTLASGVVPATGKRFDAMYTAFVTVRDGRIVAQTLYFDQLDVLVQLGLMPAAA